MMTHPNQIKNNSTAGMVDLLSIVEECVKKKKKSIGLNYLRQMKFKIGGFERQQTLRCLL